MGKTFAYIRVSTREQKEDRQLDSLAGITVDEIIIEKASGKNFTGREKYQLMKSQLRTGDLVIVKSIDRFGRNYAQICKEWESIINMGVDIQVLDMPILNTRNNQNGLTGRLITDIVLKLLVLLYIVVLYRFQINLCLSQNPHFVQSLLPTILLFLPV